MAVSRRKRNRIRNSNAFLAFGISISQIVPLSCHYRATICASSPACTKCIRRCCTRRFHQLYSFNGHVTEEAILLPASVVTSAFAEDNVVCVCVCVFVLFENERKMRDVRLKYFQFARKCTVWSQRPPRGRENSVNGTAHTIVRWRWRLCWSWSWRWRCLAVRQRRNVAHDSNINRDTGRRKRQKAQEWRTASGH